MMRVAKLVLAATLAFTSARVCFAVQTETNHNPRKLFSNVNKETSSVSRALQGGDECPTDCECLIIPKKPPCFSGMATVEVKNRGPVLMRDLEIGDMVKVDANGKFEPIYSFAHKSDTRTVEFLQIFGNELFKSPLELTSGHMLVVIKSNNGDDIRDGKQDEKGRMLPAWVIKEGDRLLLGSANGGDGTLETTTVVTKIKHVVRKGVYGPFTESGTLVVNGAVASNYLNVGVFYVFGIALTWVNDQWLFHMVQSPRRLVCKVSWKFCENETYNDEGMSYWVVYLQDILLLWRSRGDIIFVTIVLPVFMICSVSAAVEHVVVRQPMLLWLFLAVTMIVALWKAYYTTKKKMKGRVVGKEKVE